MANTSLQVCGFVVGLLGWGLAIMTTFMQAWRKNDLTEEIIELIRRTDGLWSRCTNQATGLWTCDDYDSFFLGLPVALQGARACAIISIAMGLFGSIICSLGLKCTNFGSDNPKLKARMSMIAGVLFVIGGCAIGAAVSWFAANILADFYNITVAQESKFVYGEALFVGWASMVISVVAGLLLCCGSWNSGEDEEPHRYHYNPPKPKSSAEYI